jgi:hypothetical protein
MTRKLLLFIWCLLSALVGMSEETLRFVRVVFHSQASLVAENLFLRKQLTFYQERNGKPQRLTDSARFALLFWSGWFPWRGALVVVKPETLIRWHHAPSSFCGGGSHEGGDRSCLKT